VGWCHSPKSQELDPIIYELIGRVIVETTLLEGRLIELAIRLDWQADQSARFEDVQAKYGGLHGGELKGSVQDLARAIATDLGQATFADFIGRVAQRRGERNMIAHDRPLPLSGLGTVGFRTVPKKQRSAADEVTPEALDWVGRFPCTPFRDAPADSPG
jgi:hypothetical protein